MGINFALHAKSGKNAKVYPLEKYSLYSIHKASIELNPYSTLIACPQIMQFTSVWSKRLHTHIYYYSKEVAPAIYGSYCSHFMHSVPGKLCSQLLTWIVTSLITVVCAHMWVTLRLRTHTHTHTHTFVLTCTQAY